MSSRRDAVVVTGLGLRSALGASVADVWSRVQAGHTGLRAWPDLAEEGFRIHVAARVEGEPPDGVGRGAWLASGAAADALAGAGVSAATHPRSGVFLGTTMGESDAYEAAAASGAPPLDLEQVTGRGIASAVARTLDLPPGPRRCYGTACAAGNHALSAAVEGVSAGAVDIALAGGVDPFSRIAMAGFSRVRAMDPVLCRPFDASRRGMQLGEGAAILLLERESAARARGARPLARIHPAGLTCDAHHPTAPHPEGRGMAAAMEIALQRSDLGIDAIGWICAHGTGTPPSDAAEARAITRVFGADTPPPVSSPKGALGHTMGAASAFGALLAVLALQEGIIPPTATLLHADPALDLDLPRQSRTAPDLRAVLNCGYAFGGINAALVLERAE